MLRTANQLENKLSTCPQKTSKRRALARDRSLYPVASDLDRVSIVANGTSCAYKPMHEAIPGVTLPVMSWCAKSPWAVVK